MPQLLELLLGGAVGTFVLAIFLFIQRYRDRTRLERERRLGMHDSQPTLLLPPVPGTKENRDQAAKMDDAFAQMTEGTGFDIRPEDLVALMSLIGVALGGGLYLWREQVGLGIVGLLLGMLVPLSIVWILRNRYRQKVQNLLPDALYLLARSLRAGLSMEQAISLVAEEGPQPVAREFQRASLSLKMGLTPATVIQMMAERLHLVDLNAFASTVSFHQTTGGNLPLLLDRLAAGARDRNQFRGQFWAATAQGRITSVALAAAGPLLVLGYVLFQPEHVQGFINSPRGWLFLGVAGLMEAIGLTWVYQILKIDY